jgi:dinuclear metal center YbgI/SA1388 family protein
VTANSPATLGDVVDAMERMYPVAWADDHDAVGLVAGHPDAAVARVLLAVDPVQAVVDQAVALGADLIVVHHPLLLRPVSSVRADHPKGRVVHDLISHGIGLYVAHTNADSPVRGVSDSLARALGLQAVRPLVTAEIDPLDKIVTFVPLDQVDMVIDALADAGAGALGDYDRSAFRVDGVGTFRPGPDATPTIGRPGRVEVVREARLEMVLPRRNRGPVVAALRSAHPYEEPAFDIFELAGWASDRGSGRLGRLPHPMSLADFTEHVVAALPPTAVGARAAGDPYGSVQCVAVAGGAGDFLLEDARSSGADVYVTSDLRHHPASEFREHPGAPALVDVPHWAAEWTWLPVLQSCLGEALVERGWCVDVEVSRICTDPWNYRAAGLASGGSGAP